MDYTLATGYRPNMANTVPDTKQWTITMHLLVGRASYFPLVTLISPENEGALRHLSCAMLIDI